MKGRAAVWGRWLVVFVAATAIWFGSDRAIRGPFSMPFPQADKVMHAAAYAIFAALIFRALWTEAVPVPARVLALGVLLAAVWGATDEIHQWFVPGRCCDALDWTADVLGAALAALAWTPLTKRFPRMR